MIKINQYDSTIIQTDQYLRQLGALLKNNNTKTLGGVLCPTNHETEKKLAQFIKKPSVLTSSGTAALLIALEYAIQQAGAKPITLCVSEYLYFALIKATQALVNKGAQLQVLRAKEDEVTLTPAQYTKGRFYIFILTSHHNQNVNAEVASKNIPQGERFIIEDRCLVFALQTKSNVDVECYSFTNNKLIVAGEGGCVSSNHPDFIDWAKWRTFSGVVPLNKSDAFMYLGLYALGDGEMPYKCSVSAVVSLLIQANLKSLKANIKKRVAHYHYLYSHLNYHTEQAKTPAVPLFYPLRLPKIMNKNELRRFQMYCLRHGVQTQIGVLPYHFFKKRELSKNIISLPVHSALTQSELKKIVTITQRALQNEA